MDADTGKFYFIEVNPRIQVEHTVTEVGHRPRHRQGADPDRSKAAASASIDETGIPPQDEIELNGHALQCRITTENPENNFIPDYGRITAYRGAFGFGIRVDGGTAYSGAVVTRFYDPLLEKVTAWAPTPEEVDRAHGPRPARVPHPRRRHQPRFPRSGPHAPASFASNDYTTRFIDETPELFAVKKRRDRATKLLTYIADVTVNGHPEAKGRAKPPADARKPEAPVFRARARTRARSSCFDRLGPAKFAAWMRNEKRVLVTDTTMRDAHQSLLATRMRTHDIVGDRRRLRHGPAAAFVARMLGRRDVRRAMRFLTEDPWERLALVRETVPNILTQMLLRGANGVGYTNYPDNVVQLFRAAGRRARAWIVFRIFDCLNWVENMRVAIDAVCETGKLAEGAICYTGDILDPARAKYSLRYYVDLAKELERAGCHILGDQGHGRPAEARRRAGSGQGAERGGRAADPSPHARHVGDFGRDRAGRGRCGRRRGRRGDGCDVGHDLAALPRLDRRGAAPHRPRYRPRSRSDPPASASIGRRCAASTPPSKAI